MRKIFINKKYLDNCQLEEGGTFHLTPEMILSSFAQDYFIQRQIKVVTSAQELGQAQDCSVAELGHTEAICPDIYQCIKDILSKEYGFPAHVVDEIAKRVVTEINK